MQGERIAGLHPRMRQAEARQADEHLRNTIIDYQQPELSRFYDMKPAVGEYTKLFVVHRTIVDPVAV